MGLPDSRDFSLGRLRRWLFADSAVYGKLLLSSFLGVGAIGLLAGAFLTMTFRARDGDARRVRAVEVVRAASAVEDELARLERDCSVYLATGKVACLDGFHARKGAVLEGLERLEASMPENARNRAHVWEARKCASHWLAVAAIPRMSARENGETLPEVTAEQGELVERAREALRALQQEERIEVNSQHRLESLSFEVLAQVPRMSGLLFDMERAAWEFALSGSPGAMIDYRKAAAEFDSVYGHLSVLLDGRPERFGHVREISSAVKRWQANTALVAIAERRRGEDALATLVGGEASADRARDLVAKFGDAELAEFGKASLRAKIVRVVKTTGFVAVAAVAVLMLLGSGGYSFVAYRRHLRTLEGAEAQTRSIIETTLDGVVTVDAQGMIRTMNPAAERMFGHPADSLVGKNVSRIIPQRLFLHDMSRSGRGTMMAMGQRENFYPFPIEVSVSEIVIEGRRQFVALIRDVTERKRSEETLRHIGLGVSAATGEEFIRSLVVQLSKALQTDCAFILQISQRNGRTAHTLSLAQDGHIRSLPRYELAGSACEEVVRRGFRAWSHDVRASFPEDALLEELDAQSFVAMPLADHHGRAVGVLGIADRKPTSDMQRSESTLQIFAARAGAEIERQQAEEDLAAEKERLAVTLRSISEGCITIDVAGNVELLNQAAERLTGWTHEHAVGRPLTEVLHLMLQANRESCRPALERLVETGVSPELAAPAILVAADGAERVVESSAAPIRDMANRRIGVVLVFRDMTERQRADEERRKAEKLESLGIAAGGIAHDFNNLLTAILGNLSLAMMSQGSRETLQERLAAAKGASVRAQDLAQQLLTFARGGAPIKKSESIAQLIRDTATFALRGTNVRCEFDLPADLWPGDIDTGQISHALANIAINAGQAMRDGGTLFVSAENFEAISTAGNLRPGRYLRIRLRDEGEGIPAENLDKIFDPYFSTRETGSGLGLATAYSIVKSHEGAITVDSILGEGATFCLYLPASEAATPEPAPLPETSPKGPGRVLVLDDEAVICELVACALEPLGYTVTEAYDAPTAIRYYEEALERDERFDVVISDLTIPGGMGGQEAIKRLLEIDPRVKAIVSSGYAMDPVMSRYRDFGFCACLAKPYEVAALGRLVDEVYGRAPTATVRRGAEGLAA